MPVGVPAGRIRENRAGAALLWRRSEATSNPVSKFMVLCPAARPVDCRVHCGFPGETGYRLLAVQNGGESSEGDEGEEKVRTRASHAGPAGSSPDWLFPPAFFTALVTFYRYAEIKTKRGRIKRPSSDRSGSSVLAHVRRSVAARPVQTCCARQDNTGESSKRGCHPEPAAG